MDMCAVVNLKISINSVLLQIVKTQNKANTGFHFTEAAHSLTSVGIAGVNV